MTKRAYTAMGPTVFAAGAVAAIAGAAGAGTDRATITAAVLYRSQPCSVASARLGAPTSVTAGTLELRRGGKTVRVSLLDGGTQPGTVALPGTGPVSATLILQTPRVRVTGPNGGAAERIPLRRVSAANGRLSFSVGSSEERNGHVNTLVQLQHAARVAAAAAPRQLPLVQAHVHDGPPGARPDTAFDAPNVIEVGKVDAALDAQWEPTALVHEYGHFVLHTLGAEGPDGGDHDSRRSYPARPTLAWNEGFSDAFAAVVLGRAILFSGCQRIRDLSAHPAGPPLATKQDERYAQYSQTRVGGAAYQLVGRLGGGQAGLGRLLGAVPGYRRGGHSVWTARDLRDLAAQSFESSSADHAAIDGIFFGQGMSWTANINVGFPVEPDLEFARLRYAGATIQVRVTGPGGFDCRTSSDIDVLPGTTYDGGQRAPGKKQADGGLSFSGADDCYLVSAGPGPIDFSKRRVLGFDQAMIPFPYLAGGQHWSGTYTVYARYHCEFEPGAPPGAYCPATKHVRLRPGNKALLVAMPAAIEGAPMTLVREVETAVATFKANGECHIGAVNCGV